jgi:hypothetical protein
MWGSVGEPARTRRPSSQSRTDQLGAHCEVSAVF